MYKRDGSPISSNFKNLGLSPEKLNQDELRRVRAKLMHSTECHVATVREIYYADDLRNFSKTAVEYVVRVEDQGERQGQVFNNIKALNLYGGMVNFSEIIYYPRTNPINGQPWAENTYMFDHDATQVVISFIDGRDAKPYIIGGWANTNVFSGLIATQADGIRKLEEFNGIRTNIDQDGQFIMTYYGGQRSTKPPFLTENPGTAPTTMMVDMTGAWQVSDKQNDTIRVDPAAQQIALTQYANVKPDETYGQPDTSSPGAIVNQILMDKANQIITIKAKGTTIVIDGLNDTITASTAVGGVIKITQGKVGFGGPAAELLNIVSQTLGYLNTDLGNLGYPLFNSAQYLTLKNQLDQIIGGI